MELLAVFSEFWLARHSPLIPVTGPVAVAVPVGVELPPFSYTATYAALMDAPDDVAAVGVVVPDTPSGELPPMARSQMMKKPWSMASCQCVVPTEASVMVLSTVPSIRN